MASKSKQKSATTLEHSLDDIAKLIDSMEHDNLTLEQSLNHFERGITLIKQCQTILSQAEQKVEMLVQQNQTDSLVDYPATPSTPPHHDT